MASLSQVVEQSSLPRVLLVGDSIASGYTQPVRQRLAGKAIVADVPKDGFYTGAGSDEPRIHARRRKMGADQLQLGIE